MKRIGVVPALAHARRRELLAALEAVLPVRFEPRDPGQWRDLDGVIVFEGADPGGREASAAGVPVLAATGQEPRTPAGAPVALARSDLLDPCLRGQTIDDEAAGALGPVPAEAGWTPLATASGRPLWAARDQGGVRCHLVAGLPGETASSAPLASLLTAGRFIRFLPLVHFLREVAGPEDWVGPPVRAAFIIDDPNLHAASYGYVQYRALAAHATAHGYHVAIAMVPLDAWLARRSAVDVFKRHPDQLSLVVHGNDHARHELARPASDDAAVRLMAQGLRRVAAFERRSGLAVGRVMVPPHERSSAQAFRAMRALGFEGVCLDWQCPWLPGPVARTGVERRLAGWYPAELLGGGLPVMARSYWTDPPPDLALRAFRGHPLLLFGHHQDAADPDVLAAAVDRVGGLGAARWMSLPEIARSNFATRRDGGVLSVRMSSRRASVDIPAGVEAVRVHVPLIHEGLDGTTVTAGGETSALTARAAGMESAPLPVSPGSRVELGLGLPGGVDPAGVAPPAWRPWPAVRRGVSEGRDRLGPWVHRARSAR